MNNFVSVKNVSQIFSPNLSMGENQLFSIVYSYLGHSNLERRSIVVKDSFDDYLTEADYVRNINYNQSSAIAIKYNKDIGKIRSNLGSSGTNFIILPTAWFEVPILSVGFMVNPSVDHFKPTD